MKGSPHKMGTIQGTSSALKQVKEKGPSVFGTEIKDIKEGLSKLPGSAWDLGKKAADAIGSTWSTFKKNKAAGYKSIPRK